MTKVVNVSFKCQKCNETISIEVDLDSLKYVGESAVISVLHGVPPHTILINIDRDGNVLFTRVANTAVTIPKKVVEREKATIDSKDLEKLANVKFFAAVFSAMIADLPFYVITPSEPDKVSNYIESNFKDFPITIEVVINKKIDRFSVSVIEGKYKDNFLLSETHYIAYDLSSRSFLNYDVKSKLLEGIVKKKLGKGLKELFELFEEINHLKVILNRILRELEKSEKVLLKDVLYDVKVSGKELIYLKELLKMKDIDVEKRLI